ncbi:hypothetical protein BZG36_03020 [Bifiguratus adelaidae]|uniref:5-methyltetrahydropteroyltriglutamate--homocysteine S-methyltransferase n=1 Tax=Bifiguratus adelaidae TaxID=1938954 RepID=A0A261XZK1_9FUNG|nr:hypothetical protein BZG36_03020 [Bifiguratus adelaidae]
MVQATNLGFPYVGAHRELKKHVETFWASGAPTQESTQTLRDAAADLRKAHWRVQVEQGIEQVPVGDFTFYDRMLDTSVLFGAIPKKYQDLGASSLDQYFAMGRGLQRAATATTAKIDVPAMEMKKWFDTNYHFIVPEFEENQEFALAETPAVVSHYHEAKAAGVANPRPVLIGPVTFLYLGKASKASSGFDTLDLLPKLLKSYGTLIQQLAAAGASTIQVDEPILVLDLPVTAKLALEKAYAALHKSASEHSVKLLVASYFGRLDSNLFCIKDNVDALHIDLVKAPEQLDVVLDAIASSNLVLSLGVVDGRNIWKNNLRASLQLLQKAVSKIGLDRILLAPSCSLAHSPYSIEFETEIRKSNPELYDWLSFAVEKCREVAVLTKALREGEDSVSDVLQANERAILSRKESKHTTDAEVRQKVEAINEADYHRHSVFAQRREAQVKRLNLPLYPTTTIGSFPQTKEIRVARNRHNKGLLSDEDYQAFIRSEIERAVRFQEEVDLDVFVHGEPERNDMVEHFGHLLHGYAFTQNGWVVSYGSRCVKPPVIFGDVRRKQPMTIEEIKYAQSLTSKPMKAMLTGPVTMWKWSFPRDDVPASTICQQIGLALRDEVVDLEAAGIPCIQVDEPAIREGLPLRRQDWDAYLKWSVPCFRLSVCGVRDDTQIHTHMCYSDFNDIFDAIQDMDADVITIENSKSDEKLLKVFATKNYTNEIGPGLYDIHSPRVPSVEEMIQRLQALKQHIPEHLLWVNPDCGLKSRGWPETEAALRNLVAVAKHFRSQASATFSA